VTIGHTITMYATRNASFQSERGPKSPRNPFATPHRSRSPTPLYRNHTSNDEAVELSSSHVPPWFPGSLVQYRIVGVKANIILGLAPPLRRKHKSARLTEDEKNRLVLNKRDLGKTYHYDSYEKPWTKVTDSRYDYMNRACDSYSDITAEKNGSE
jgi:hypothetical protein